MSPLPPGDRRRNEELVAERLHWPDGALEACRAIERDYPEWLAYWTRGNYPEPTEQGYRAVLRRHNHHVQLLASDPATLRELVGDAQAALPPLREDRPPFTPLIRPES